MTDKQITRRCCGLYRVAVLAMGVGGCTGEVKTVQVTDSAGIRIVANQSTDSGWRDMPRWTVTEDLVIGTDSGAPELQFGRIGDLAVSTRSDIAVIDQLNGVVRVFDSSGTHRVSIGRSGRGPGELSRSANGIYWLGTDSLLVLDPGERRQTIFRLDGTVDTVMPLPPSPTGQGWSRLSTGDLLMRGLTISRVEGRFNFWDALLKVRVDGSAADTLFEFDYARTDLGGPGRLKIQLLVNTVVGAAFRWPDRVDGARSRLRTGPRFGRPSGGAHNECAVGDAGDYDCRPYGDGGAVVHQASRDWRRRQLRRLAPGGSPAAFSGHHRRTGRPGRYDLGSTHGSSRDH